jgi:YHS domain-containing protein
MEPAGGGKKAPVGDKSASSRKFVLRSDKSPPVIWEVLEGGKSYREHAGDLNELQKDRRIQERNEIELSKKLTRKEYEEWKRENPYLRPDGSREVKVLREPGEKILGHQCEHIVVTENGWTIVDAQVTKDVPGGGTYYELYRRLGAFSEEVLKELAKIPGLPLRGKVTVVTALPTYEFQVEAKSIAVVDLQKDAFELPGAEKEEVSREVACANCGQPVDPENPGARAIWRGNKVYFCCEACADDFFSKRPADGAGSKKAEPKLERAK